jgi:hypothetical protein
VLAHCGGGSRCAWTAAASARETLACLEPAEAIGFIGPVESELGALSQHVIDTLVRLVEPQR